MTMHAAPTLHEAETMLGYIAHAADRQTWLRVGMGLKNEYGDAAYSLWDDWAAQADNYHAKSSQITWRNFKDGRGIGIASVIQLAQQGGYRQPQGAATEAELAEQQYRRQLKEQKAVQARQDRETQAAQAAQTAKKIWARANKITLPLHHPYLLRKQIAQPEACRIEGDRVIIPMIRYDLPREQALVGLQTIAPDGSKLFSKHMAKAGAACRLGTIEAGQPLFICEGWATGISIRQALGHAYPVFVTFDAYNLVVASQIIHECWPKARLVICADDDWALRNQAGRAHNVGRIQAQIAQDNLIGLGAKVVRCAPSFDAGRHVGQTDFNDQYRDMGPETVQDTLRLALATLKGIYG